MVIRKATKEDIPAVVGIYDEILTEEEEGRATIGWKRGVYPTKETATDALALGTLYVGEEAGQVVATAKIDHVQPSSYASAAWQIPATGEEALVLHTLIVSPNKGSKGWGRAFLDFYMSLARERGCKSLRMDTNAKNIRARAIYAKYGFREVGIIPCMFNGLPDVALVCLEMKL